MEKPNCEERSVHDEHHENRNVDDKLKIFSHINFFFERMSAADLVARRFAPFLVFSEWKELQHVLYDYKARFKTSLRPDKGLAVSEDGKVLRMNVTDDGYNDTFTWEEGELVLNYVCGIDEERRRQNLNVSGDAIRVTLDIPKRTNSIERHGVLHGTFKRIEKVSERGADGLEIFVPRAIIKILGYEDADKHVVMFPESDNDASGSLDVAKRIKHDFVQHLVFDTESAAPVGDRMLGQRQSFPILEIAYFRVTQDFRRALCAGSMVLKYDANVAGQIGNDASNSVLKIPLQELQHGHDAKDALRMLLEQMRIVYESGGFVFAHNVAHDLGQIRATAKLLNVSLADQRIRCVDTVRTAVNFVYGSANRWMKLAELAQVSGIPATGAVHGGLHYAIDDALLLLQILRAQFPPDKVERYADDVELE